MQRIALHGLGADEVAQIMTAVAGHELDEDGVELAGEIAAETDGNPFFVGEILRSLSESGALVVRRGERALERRSLRGVALPESVREVIERRVERLGDEAREVADAGGGDRPRRSSCELLERCSTSTRAGCSITSRRRSPPRCWPSRPSGSGSFASPTR